MAIVEPTSMFVIKNFFDVYSSWMLWVVMCGPMCPVLSHPQKLICLINSLRHLYWGLQIVHTPTPVLLNELNNTCLALHNNWILLNIKWDWNVALGITYFCCYLKQIKVGIFYDCDHDSIWKMHRSRFNSIVCQCYKRCLNS